LADMSGVPPYVIFSDKSLVEMATYFPQSDGRLLDVHGVGTVKQEKYGPVFLPIIREYCSLHHIEERTKSPRRDKTRRPPSIAKKRHEIIGEVFNAGQSFSRIIKDFSIKRATVLDHLFRYFQDGNSIIESDEMSSLSTVSPEQKRFILDRFEEFGTERLKPVFDSLDGEVDYEELKILRLYYIGRKGLTGDVHTGAIANRPVIKEIVCLANSRKYSGRCVAGKELLGDQIGRWVRPVSNCETGELSIKETSYGNGKPPELLDVIAITLSRHDPHSYQTENYIVGKGLWIRKQQLSLSLLPKLCDHVDSLWINGYHSNNGLNDRISEEIVKERVRSSLLFIKPDKASITVEEGPNLLKRVRSRFRFAGEEYWLPVLLPLVVIF